MFLSFLGSLKMIGHSQMFCCLSSDLGPAICKSRRLRSSFFLCPYKYLKYLWISTFKTKNKGLHVSVFSGLFKNVELMVDVLPSVLGSRSCPRYINLAACRVLSFSILKNILNISRFSTSKMTIGNDRCFCLFWALQIP